MSHNQGGWNHPKFWSVLHKETMFGKLWFVEEPKKVVPLTLWSHWLCFPHSQDGFLACLLPSEEHLQALVASFCIQFASSRVRAILHPILGYMPKVPCNIACSVVLQPLYPIPFLSTNQERLNLLCPVMAFDCYIHQSAQWCKIDQILVCFGSPRQGSSASKQKISKCISEAISTAYEASKALLSGVSL